VKSSGIVVALVLLMVLTGRSLLNTGRGLDHEMEAYVHNLNYDFSSRIDSTVWVNRDKDLGYLICRVTMGDTINLSKIV